MAQSNQRLPMGRSHLSRGRGRAKPARGVIKASAGAFFFTGSAASVVRPWRVTADAGSFLFTGQSAAVSIALPDDGITDYKTVAAAGSFLFTGDSLTFALDYRLVAAAGSFLFTGQSAAITVANDEIIVAADAGSWTFTGQAAAITASGADAAWTTAFIARTSGLSGPETTAVKAFLNTLATAGLDAKCEVMHILALPGSNALLNVKSTSYTATATATHTDLLGYTGDGSSTNVDTGFSPRTNRTVSDIDDCAWFFVQATSADYDNGPGICINNGDFHNFVSQSDFGGGLGGYLLGYGVGTGTGATAPYGMTTVTFTGPTTFTSYYNDTQNTHTTSATVDADFSSGNLCYLGGSAIGFGVGPIGIGGMFSGLSSGEVTTLFTAAYTLLHTLNPTGYP